MKQYTEIDSKYRWNTGHIFETPEDFEKLAHETVTLIDTIPPFRGSLDEKKQVLDCLKVIYTCSGNIMRLGSYARRKRDTQMDVSQYQELTGLVESLSTSFTSASAFIDPELLALNSDVLETYIGDDDFSVYRRYLNEIIRNKPHTLSDSEEMILAKFSGVRNGQYEAFSAFSSADIEFPEVTLSDGSTITVNQPEYTIHRQSDVREDRKKVFDAFWGTYDKYRNTISKLLHYQIKQYTTVADIRRFDSSLHRAMHANELPRDFFDTLTGHIRNELGSLHDYLQLKKDVLELPDLGYHDIYASMVSGGSTAKHSHEASVTLVNNALTPMTEEYRRVITDAMKPGSGWVDVYPSAKKRNGAYMSGEAYDIHPYVLLNHTDDYSSVSTLAHEMGHAMHSYYSNSSQPFETSQYTIFVAEVASIFNEVLLITHLLDTLDDGMEKRYLRNHFIEMIRSTVFRQMQFAEFEDALYKKVEAGEMLTPDFLNEIYRNTLNDYYGVDRGIMEIDPLYAAEWSFVPHFYYNYYVYQYVVGFIGALSLATGVRNGDIPAEQYIDGFLRAGSSKPPLEILKDAGVDLTGPEPYQRTADLLREQTALLRDTLT